MYYLLMENVKPQRQCVTESCSLFKQLSREHAEINQPPAQGVVGMAIPVWQISGRKGDLDYGFNGQTNRLLHHLTNVKLANLLLQKFSL